MPLSTPELRRLQSNARLAHQEATEFDSTTLRTDATAANVRKSETLNQEADAAFNAFEAAFEAHNLGGLRLRPLRGQFQGERLKDKEFPRIVKQIRDGGLDGETFNTDGTPYRPAQGEKVDVVTVASENVPASDLTPKRVEKAFPGFEALLDSEDVKLGLFRLATPDAEGRPQVSVDLNAIVDQAHRENTIDFARRNNQESIFDLDTFETVPTEGTGETVLKNPAAIENAVRALVEGRPVQFQGKRAGELDLDLSTDQRRAQRAVKAEVKAAQAQYPEALPLRLRKEEDGSYSLDEKGRAKPQGIRYNLDKTPLAKEAAKGLKTDEAKEQAIARAYADKIKDAYEVAARDPDIAAGANWYSLAREKLTALFGEDTKLFTELLAATSVKTDVPTNFRYSVDAYNRFKQGDFDAMIAKYREGKDLWEDIARGPDGRSQEAEKVLRSSKLGEPTRAAFFAWWIKKHNLRPTQSNGKLFGQNSDAVLRVLDGSWRESLKGLKTGQFADNLSGASFEATIDVWAARLMHRLGNESNSKPWRILPRNERAVKDADFFMAQKAYRLAGDELGISPDSLQAIMWFAEKDHWDRAGWTTATGAEKSDFNTMLGVSTRTPEGRVIVEPVARRGRVQNKEKAQLDLGTG